MSLVNAVFSCDHGKQAGWVGHAVSASCQHGVGTLSKLESRGGTGRAWSEFIATMQIKSPEPVGAFFLQSGGGGRNRTGVHGFAGRCITTLLPRQGFCTALEQFVTNRLFAVPIKKKGSKASLRDWSGKRGSNSRPQPWQGCALPTELFPRNRLCRHAFTSTRPHISKLERETRLELATSTLARLRSTN